MKRYLLIFVIFVISVFTFFLGRLSKSYFPNLPYFSNSPNLVVMQSVIDGDTFVLDTGQTVRLIGINAPERGQKNFDIARSILAGLLDGKKIYLEYDRYQDDKYGRILAWVWIDCESTPKFLPYDYMHLSGNASKPGLVENPEGCKNGKLVNEELVRSNLAVPVVYKDRGPTKYESRLKSLSPQFP